MTTVDDVRRMLMGKQRVEETAVSPTEVDAQTAVTALPSEKAPIMAAEIEPEFLLLTNVDATDAAIKLAAKNGIDLETVAGTGTDGRILLADVKALIDQ